MHRDQNNSVSAHSLKSYQERQPTQALNMLLQTSNEDELSSYITQLILQILEEREKNC